ncbi:heavy metal transport/detoxification protein [Sediminibacterium sp. KACHI17]
MEFITFKTNINSESAVEKIAPLLNTIVGKANWQIDISSSDKKLTAYSQSILNEIEIISAIHKAGFSAISIEDYYLIY